MALYVDEGQKSHALEPALEKDPAMQGVQELDATGEKVPARQVWQDEPSDDCASVEYVPAPQAAQIVDPVCSE